MFLVAVGIFVFGVSHAERVLTTQAATDLLPTLRSDFWGFWYPGAWRVPTRVRLDVPEVRRPRGIDYWLSPERPKPRGSWGESHTKTMTYCAFVSQYFADGSRWHFVRLFRMHAHQDVRMGSMAQAPLGERCVAHFAPVRYAARTLPESGTEASSLQRCYATHVRRAA